MADSRIEITITINGTEYQRTIPEETFCGNDLRNGVIEGLDPIDIIMALADAGSKAIRKEGIKTDGNDIFEILLLGDQ